MYDYYMIFRMYKIIAKLNKYNRGIISALQYQISFLRDIFSLLIITITKKINVSSLKNFSLRYLIVQNEKEKKIKKFAMQKNLA